MHISEEIHPDWYYDVSYMKTLILGSFPPYVRKYYQFYYPNPINKFWKILSELSGIPLQHTKTDADKAIQERQQIMEKLQVGVQNVGYKIQRVGNSSLDANITIIEFQDILGIIEKHKELQRILLPGFSGPSSTFWSFIAYLKKHDIAVPEKIKPIVNYTFEININSRIIECVVLNSTSTATSVPYDVVLGQFRKYIK